jgi:hypothetical protein
LASTNASDARFRRRTVNQFVAQSLMIPFTMIMGHILGDRSTEMTLTERNQSIQTLLFDRPDEAFGVGVGVSCRLHRQRAVRHKPFVLSIPSIRCMAGRSR